MTHPAHSPLGASSCERWWNCAGSVALNASLPDEPPSEYAAHGTRVHALLEHCLRRQEPNADDYVGYNLDGLSPKHPDAAPVFTPEDVAAVNVALGLVYSILEPNDYLHIEHRLDLSSVVPNGFGTADCIILKPRDKWLHVIDYKHGAGVPVEVNGNKQLRYYALGALLAFMGEAEIEKITAWVVQPRLPHADGPVRHEVYDPFDLLDWMLALRAAAERALSPAAPLVPGSWCKFCKAARLMACPAFEQKARAAATDAFGVVVAPNQLPAMTPEEHGRRLAEAETLRAYLKALDEFTAQRARQVLPAGWKWIAGRGVRKWAQSETAVLNAIQESIGRDISERVCPSPAQTEKLLGKALYREHVAPLVEQKHAAPRLVRSEDKRPALSLQEVNSPEWKTEAFDMIE